MLYNKIKEYLSANSINIIDVDTFFELKDFSDGNGVFISFWDEVNIGIGEPNREQLDSISNLDVLRVEIIPQIKAEAGKRIIIDYPEWKQINHMVDVVDIQNKELIGIKTNVPYVLNADEIATVAAAQAAKTEIFNIRAKSDELEASLDSMTLDQLKAFDPTDESNWI